MLHYAIVPLCSFVLMDYCQREVAWRGCQKRIFGNGWPITHPHGARREELVCTAMMRGGG